jgi:hypothetical protein
MFTTVVIFHHKFICYGMKLFLTARMPKGETIFVDYQQGRWEKGSVIFQNIRMSGQNRTEESGFDLKIEQLQVLISVQLFPFHLSSKFLIDSPEISLLNSQRSSGKKERGLYSLCKKYLFKREIEIHEGKLTLTSDKTMDLFFSIHTKQLGSKKGQFCLAESKEGLECPLLLVNFATEHKQMLFDFQMAEVELPWMFSIAQFFSPSSDPTIEIVRGTLSGHFNFDLSPQNVFSKVEYDLRSTKVLALNTRYGVTFDAKRLNWCKEGPIDEEMGPWFPLSSLEKNWPNFIGHGELIGSKISFIDPITGDRHGRFCLDGTICLDNKALPLADFQGFFTKEEKRHPLHIVGNSSKGEEGAWGLSVDLIFYEEEEKMMTAAVSLTSAEEKGYILETHFQKLFFEPIELFQSLITVKIPHIFPIDIRGETISGALRAVITEEKIASLEIENLQIEKGGVYDPQSHLFLSADQIEGNGEFDFAKPELFDGTSWEMEITNGKVSGEKIPDITEIKAQISMHDQYLKPSMLLGKIGDIEGEVQLEGLFTHLNLGFNLTLTPEMAIDLLLADQKQNRKKGLPVNLEIEMRLQTGQEEIAAQGTLHLAKQEEEMGEILFRANWNKSLFAKEGIFKGLKQGWFKSDDLNSEILNIPLTLFDKNWSFEGTVGVEGAITEETLSLTLDPADLCYISSYLFLSPGHGGKDVPLCHFTYDFLKGAWTGIVPLKNAQLIQKSFGITFDAFSSDLCLKEEGLHFNSVAAITENLFLQGEVSLDYQYGNYGKLSIGAHHIEGTTESVQRFLRHFNLFSNLNLPLHGEVRSGKEGMTLEAYVGEKEEMLSWKVNMLLQDTVYEITPTCAFEGLTTEFKWSWEDQKLSLINSDGSLRLGQALHAKYYHLNIPVAVVDLEQGKGSYDLRLETPTHDICRLIGHAKRDDAHKEIQIHIDPELTRFFGAQIDFHDCAFTDTGELLRLNFETDLSSRDLYHHIDFLIHGGLIPVRAEMLEEMQSPRFEGIAHLNMEYGKTEQTFSIRAKSDHFVFGTVDLNELFFEVQREKELLKLKEFSAGSLKMKAEMIKREKSWHIPSVSIDWKDSKLRGEDGEVDLNSKVVTLPLSKLNVDLKEMLKLFPYFDGYDLNYVKGQMGAAGEIVCDFSLGLKEIACDANLNLVAAEFGNGNLRVESGKPIHLHISKEKGLHISEAGLNFFHPRSNQLWAKCQFDTLEYDLKPKTWKGTGCQVIVPPEMLHHLGATKALPYLNAEEESLNLLGYHFKWDNQIELAFDFSFGESIGIQGSLKEGYYWINDKAWYLNNFEYQLSKGDLFLKMDTLIDHHPFDLRAEVSFLPTFKTSITIKEPSTSHSKEKRPLKIVTDWNENKGFFIQSIEGVISGLDVCFRHNPKGSFLDQMVLSGQLKVDAPRLSKWLPKPVQKAIEEFEIGKGYELSGDCIISKEKLLDSHFTGYLRGKNFELMGSQMETLLSEITIHTDQITLSKFNLSDQSGIFVIDEVHLATLSSDDEPLKQPQTLRRQRPSQQGQRKWKVVIPTVMIQDFRPSLLKKIGRYKGRIKPLNIREMHFENIRGVVGETKSFTGKGRLLFTNTFKSDYTLFDIPFEILGRLGLDMGLLVPVRGRLDYVMADGKVYLTELSESFSEGKRSKFYLSPSEMSFIDLDGTVNIKIKMKQYVLLKITEPFTLSIGGTFQDLRYSLK